MRTRFIITLTLALLATSCGDDDLSLTTTTGAPPATTTTGALVTTSDASAAVGLVWVRVPHDEAAFGGSGDQEMVAVVAGGPGLVAVGSETFESFEGDAAVWTSPDGLTWTRVPHNDATFGGPDEQAMTGVAAGGPGLVAVGSDGGSAAVWTSPDGLTWARVAHDEAVFGGPYTGMSAVAAGGPGLVAVGSDGGSAAVWTSPDGLTWTRIPYDEGVFGGDEPAMIGVAAGGPGLVAVGYDFASAAVWTSPDGLTWTRRPHDEAVFGPLTRMSAVAAGGPGLVAVGYDSNFLDVVDLDDLDEDAVVWTSPDGLTWTRVPHDEAVFGAGFEEMYGVVASGLGLVAVGYDESAAYPAAVWFSADGVTWTRLAYEAALSDVNGALVGGMNGAAEGGAGVVVVGDDWSGGDGDAAVWVLFRS